MADSRQTSLSTGSSLAMPVQKLPNVVSLAIAARVLHGMTVVLLLAATIERHTSTTSVASLLPLVIASLICGIAMGVAADRFLATAATLKLPSVMSAIFVAVGLLALSSGGGPAVLLAAAFSIGFGIQTEWSSLADAARKSLSSRNRWNGMKWFQVAFSAGLFVGAFLVHTASAPIIVAVAVIGVTLGLMRSDFPVRPQTSEAVQDESISAKESQIATAAVSSIPPAVAPAVPHESIQAATDAEECDAVECCGGGAKELQPTAFVHSVLISAVGFCLLWGFLPGLLAAHLNTASFAFVGAGIFLGQLLLLSAAPRVGYSVVVLPFLLLCIPVVVLTALITPHTFLFGIATFLGGFFAGPVVCGISAIVGEHSSDCPTDAKRTRIISTSLFATAAVILLAGFVPIASFPAILWGIACVIGIIAISAIPSPVVSNLGTDESDEQTDAELREIVAAIKH